MKRFVLHQRFLARIGERALQLPGRAPRLGVVLTSACLLACDGTEPTALQRPPEAAAVGVRVRVDLGSGTASVISTPQAASASYSLIGTDAITLEMSNFVSAPLSGGRRLIQFDVALTNTLSGVSLLRPATPTPPTGSSGLLLFPFQISVVSGKGAVAPSTDWDGAPHSFFNDTKCAGSPTRDCYRWEDFAAPLAPGATSEVRTVGFQVDQTVQTFDVVMLLAAELYQAPAAPASIVLSANSAAFMENGMVMTPASSVLTVSNGGGGTLTGLSTSVSYAAGQPTGWLAAVLSATTAPTLLTLAPSVHLLADGMYTATVEVSAAGASNLPQSISVTLVVAGSVAGNTAIFVSESDLAASDDAGCGLGPIGTGTNRYPCSSIARGIARAVVTGRAEVRVADGRYNEAVTLTNGISLLGGYAPDTWQRHLTSTNTVIDGVSSSGNHDRTVIASAITASTVFEGFVVRGAVNAKAGGNSYAIYVASSGASLVIRNNVIYGGVGGPGGAGTAGAAGSAGTAGTGRSSNPAGYDALIAAGAVQCDAFNNRSHTNGGVLVMGGDNISGGNGGGNRCPPSTLLAQFSALAGSTGQAGAGIGGGAAGAGGNGGLDARLETNGTVCVVPASMTGNDGARGGDGAAGTGASGGGSSTGSVAGGNWLGLAGGIGGSGFNGGGGGGGGAGGGASCVNCAENRDRLGGHGGGGGSGGGGGAGGGGGNAGGGAFGIFIVGGSAPAVSGNVIVRGTGGAGGVGGGAGSSGVGGSGADGGLSALFCTGPAGRGGDGGTGGHGGGGGGGSGGGSFGIYTQGVGIPTYCSPAAANNIGGGAGGNGGAGGFSPVNAGGTGSTGLVAACVFNP